MTTPIEQITVECSGCGHRYEDYHRRSMTLSLDDVDDDYIYLKVTFFLETFSGDLFQATQLIMFSI